MNVLVPSRGVKTSLRAPKNYRSTKTSLAYNSLDYFGLFPTGVYLFASVDETSKYPEVHVTHSSSATTANLEHFSQFPADLVDGI